MNDQFVNSIQRHFKLKMYLVFNDAILINALHFASDKYNNKLLNFWQNNDSDAKVKNVAARLIQIWTCCLLLLLSKQIKQRATDTIICCEAKTMLININNSYFFLIPLFKSISVHANYPEVKRTRTTEARLSLSNALSPRDH